MKKNIDYLKSNLSSLFKKINSKKEKLKKKTEQELIEIEKIDDDKLSIKISEDKEEKKQFSMKDSIKFWLAGVIVAYVWYLLFNSLEFIYLILASYIISMWMESFIELINKKVKIRWLSIWITYFLFVVFILWWLLLIVPFIIKQWWDLIWILLDRIRLFQEMLQTNWLEWTIKESKLLNDYMKDVLIKNISEGDIGVYIQTTLQNNISWIVSSMSSYLKNAWSIAYDIISWFFSTIFQFVIVITMSIFFSIEKRWVINFFWNITKSKIVVIKLEKLYKKLWFWLKWQLFLCFCIWFAVWTVLWTLSLFWLDLPNKATLAIIAWVTEFLPYIWPLLWAVPAVLLALIKYNVLWALIVIGVYYAIQQVENNILVPIVMNKALWLSPILIFISMLIWWTILWFIWVILAVPIAVILTLLYEEIIKK